jgi:hypothetical protein
MGKRIRPSLGILYRVEWLFSLALTDAEHGSTRAM